MFDLSLELYGHALFNEADDLFLTDVTDEVAMSELVASVKPDIIFHAAAKKHLSLVQSSPQMAIRTNVFGTLSVVKAAIEHSVQQVVNVSTDKAANPTSVLGWSKRLAELIGAHYTNAETRISSVRFGNVLGSNGSLVPILQDKLRKGEPMQVTHPEATRYFMTIPEATGLVIEAARMSAGGEVFILDMGTPLTILDLIRDYTFFAGKPMPEIQFTGLRQGEKLAEELFSSEETSSPTIHPRIRMSLISEETEVESKLSELSTLLSLTTEPEILRDALTLNKKGSHALDRTASGVGTPLLGSY